MYSHTLCSLILPLYNKWHVWIPVWYNFVHNKKQILTKDENAYKLPDLRILNE